MASIQYVPGRGYVTMYGDQEVVIGSQEHQAIGDAYEADRNAFKAANFYDRNKDYSGMFAGFFGDPTGGYDGPNSSWRRAYGQRKELRDKGIWDNVSHFENRVQYQDRDNWKKMLDRNNAIEYMMGQGYTFDQIDAHLAGKQNIANVTPGGSAFTGQDNYGGGQRWEPTVPPKGTVLPPKDLTAGGGPAFTGNPFENRDRGPTLVENYRRARAEAAERKSVSRLFTDYLGEDA